MSLKHAFVRLPATVAATALLAGAGVALAPTQASAATAPVSAATPQSALSVAQSVLGTAASLKGTPYRYGGTSRSGFDCSGFTQYVLKRNGISVPRTAQQQYRAAKKISKSQIRPGDLVFFVSGGYAYHVGIYAGDGMIWHSPRTGSSVKLAKIWTSNWVAGRVI